MLSKIYKVFGVVAVVLALGGCATNLKVDKAAFKDSRVRTILVLPPLNSTDDVQASNGVFSVATQPLEEIGYYVVPITWVAEVFQQVGPVKPAEIHALPLARLRELFAADAVLYLDVKKYGNMYTVVNSSTVVQASARLVDLQSGRQLWSGTHGAVSDEEGFTKVFLIPGLISSAITKALADDAKSLRVADKMSYMLFHPDRTNGVLPGPRSPNYGRD